MFPYSGHDLSSALLSYLRTADRQKTVRRPGRCSASATLPKRCNCGSRQIANTQSTALAEALPSHSSCSRTCIRLGLWTRFLQSLAWSTEIDVDAFGQTPLWLGRDIEACEDGMAAMKDGGSHADG